MKNSSQAAQLFNIFKISKHSWIQTIKLSTANSQACGMCRLKKILATKFNETSEVKLKVNTIEATVLLELQEEFQEFSVPACIALAHISKFMNLRVDKVNIQQKIFLYFESRLEGTKIFTGARGLSRASIAWQWKFKNLKKNK